LEHQPNIGDAGVLDGSPVTATALIGFDSDGSVDRVVAATSALTPQ
jgi:hypothetical protein